jgi:hypothetical protein
MDFETIALIQRLANGVLARHHRDEPTRATVEVRRRGKSAELHLSWQHGKAPEHDRLIPLGNLLDEILMELRLEKNRLGQQIFQTTDPDFRAGEQPVYFVSITRMAGEESDHGC